MFSPVSLLTVMIAVVAPEYDNCVVSVRASLKSIENAPHHCVCIADAGQISVNGIIKSIQCIQLLDDS